MVTIADFLEYDFDNPHIWDKFEEFALLAASRRKHFGVGAVMERIRWYTEIEANRDDYKVNNNWRAFYARKFALKYPEHAGFFRCRESVADGLSCSDFTADWRPVYFASGRE